MRRIGEEDRSFLGHGHKPEFKILFMLWWRGPDKSSNKSRLAPGDNVPLPSIQSFDKMSN